MVPEAPLEKLEPMKEGGDERIQQWTNFNWCNRKIRLLMV